MSLPALATVEDLEVRLGRSCDRARAQAALVDASALIRAEAGETWVGDDNELAGVPDVVVALALKVARRSMQNPEGYTSETVGPFSVGLPASDAYLRDDEKRAIRKAVRGSGISSVQVSTPWQAAADEADATVGTWGSI